jgi:hypothetical protein
MASIGAFVSLPLDRAFVSPGTYSEGLLLGLSSSESPLRLTPIKATPSEAQPPLAEITLTLNPTLTHNAVRLYLLHHHSLHRRRRQRQEGWLGPQGRDSFRLGVRRLQGRHLRRLEGGDRDPVRVGVWWI